MSRPPKAGEAIAVGEKWFVRLPAATALTRVTVLSVTPLCVQLRESASLFYDLWYERKDLGFVERVGWDDRLSTCWTCGRGRNEHTEGCSEKGQEELADG